MSAESISTALGAFQAFAAALAAGCAYLSVKAAHDAIMTSRDTTETALVTRFLDGGASSGMKVAVADVRNWAEQFENRLVVEALRELSWMGMARGTVSPALKSDPSTLARNAVFKFIS